MRNVLQNIAVDDKLSDPNIMVEIPVPQRNNSQVVKPDRAASVPGNTLHQSASGLRNRLRGKSERRPGFGRRRHIGRGTRMRLCTAGLTCIGRGPVILEPYSKQNDSRNKGCNRQVHGILISIRSMPSLTRQTLAT